MGVVFLLTTYNLFKYPVVFSTRLWTLRISITKFYQSYQGVMELTQQVLDWPAGMADLSTLVEMTLWSETHSTHFVRSGFSRIVSRPGGTHSAGVRPLDPLEVTNTLDCRATLAMTTVGGGSSTPCGRGVQLLDAGSGTFDRWGEISRLTVVAQNDNENCKFGYPTIKIL